MKHRGTLAAAVVGTLAVLFSFMIPQATAEEVVQGGDGSGVLADGQVQFYVGGCTTGADLIVSIDGEKAGVFVGTAPWGLYIVDIPEGVDGNVLSIKCFDGESSAEAVKIFPGAGTCLFAGIDGEVVDGKNYTGKFNPVCIKIVDVIDGDDGGQGPCTVVDNVIFVDDCIPVCDDLADSGDVFVKVVEEIVDVDACIPVCGTDGKVVVARLAENGTDACVPVCDDTTFQTVVATDDITEDPCVVDTGDDGATADGGDDTADGGDDKATDDGTADGGDDTADGGDDKVTDDGTADGGDDGTVDDDDDLSDLCKQVTGTAEGFQVAVMILTDTCDIDPCAILGFSAAVELEEPGVDTDVCIIDECDVVAFQPAIEIEVDADDCIIDECVLTFGVAIAEADDDCVIDHCEIFTQVVEAEEPADDCVVDECDLVFQTAVEIVDDEDPCVLDECDVLKAQPAISLDDGRELDDVCESIEADLVATDPGSGNSGTNAFTAADLSIIADAKAGATGEVLGISQTAVSTFAWAASDGTSLEEGVSAIQPASLADDPADTTGAILDASEPVRSFVTVAVKGNSGIWILQSLGAIALLGAMASFVLNRRRITA